MWQKTKEKLNKISSSKILYLGLFVLLGGLIYFLTPIKSYALTGVGEMISSALSWVLLQIVALLAQFLLWIMGVLADIFQYSDFFITPVITGWTLVRDLCNMFFVLILLIIAFSTILKISTYHYKSTLVKLLLMAIFINFSRTILGFLIDFSQVIMLTFVHSFREAMLVNLTDSLGVAKIVEFNNGASGGSGFDALGALVLAIIFMVVAIFTMIVYVVVLLYRIINLWILIILSPLAFFAYAVPGLQAKVGSQYWGKFWTQLTTGPVIAFFMWLALLTLTANTDTAMITSSKSGIDASVATTAEVCKSTFCKPETMFKFIIAIALLLIGLQQAQQAGGFAGNFAGKAMGTLGAMGVGAAGGFGLAKKGWNKGKDMAKSGYDKTKAAAGASWDTLKGGLAKSKPGQKFVAGMKKVKDNTGLSGKQLLAGGLAAAALGGLPALALAGVGGAKIVGAQFKKWRNKKKDKRDQYNKQKDEDKGEMLDNVGNKTERPELAAAVHNQNANAYVNLDKFANNEGAVKQAVDDNKNNFANRYKDEEGNDVGDDEKKKRDKELADKGEITVNGVLIIDPTRLEEELEKYKKSTNDYNAAKAQINNSGATDDEKSKLLQQLDEGVSGTVYSKPMLENDKSNELGSIDQKIAREPIGSEKYFKLKEERKAAEQKHNSKIESNDRLRKFIGPAELASIDSAKIADGQKISLGRPQLSQEGLVNTARAASAATIGGVKYKDDGTVDEAATMVATKEQTLTNGAKKTVVKNRFGQIVDEKGKIYAAQAQAGGQFYKADMQGNVLPGDLKVPTGEEKPDAVEFKAPPSSWQAFYEKRTGVVDAKTKKEASEKITKHAENYKETKTDALKVAMRGTNNEDDIKAMALALADRGDLRSDDPEDKALIMQAQGAFAKDKTAKKLFDDADRKEGGTARFVKADGTFDQAALNKELADGKCNPATFKTPELKIPSVLNGLFLTFGNKVGDQINSLNRNIKAQGALKMGLEKLNASLKDNDPRKKNVQFESAKMGNGFGQYRGNEGELASLIQDFGGANLLRNASSRDLDPNGPLATAIKSKPNADMKNVLAAVLREDSTNTAQVLKSGLVDIVKTMKNGNSEQQTFYNSLLQNKNFKDYLT